MVKVLPLVAILAVSPAVLAQTPSSSSKINFARSFKDNEMDRYSVNVFTADKKISIVSEIEEDYKGLKDNVAQLHCQVLKADVVGWNIPNNSPMVSYDTPATRQGMPANVDIMGSGEFILFGTIPGITPVKQVSPGDSFDVHWKNGAGNLDLQGSGKITKLDDQAKTFTVSWDLNLQISVTNSITVGVKLTSVYNAADCSLVSSSGTMNFAPQIEFQLNVAREKL